MRPSTGYATKTDKLKQETPREHVDKTARRGKDNDSEDTMKDKDKDRDPVKAQKRAISDFRCAVRKLVAEAEGTVAADAINKHADLIQDLVSLVRAGAAASKEGAA